MSYIKGIDRNQQVLLPPSLDEFVASDSMVRVMDAFVEGLNLKETGFTKSVPAHTGRPAYDPQILLKCYIYGYTNRIRSSRRLALECTRNIEMMFLTGALTPDFRTVADFRKDNTAAIKAVFSSFVKSVRAWASTTAVSLPLMALKYVRKMLVQMPITQNAWIKSLPTLKKRLEDT